LFFGSFIVNFSYIDGID